MEKPANNDSNVLAKIVKLHEKKKNAARALKDARAARITTPREAAEAMDEAVKQAEGSVGTPTASDRLEVVIQVWKERREDLAEAKEAFDSAKADFESADEAFEKAIESASQIEMDLGE